MKKYIFIIIIFLFPFITYSLNVAVFPTVCIPYNKDDYIDLSNLIINELEERGLTVISKESLSNILNGVNIQNIEYNSILSNKFGELLEADSLYFNTLIFNGEYYALDFHRIDINKNTYYHKTYSFNNSVVENGDFTLYGIKYIVNDFFIGDNDINNIFFNINSIDESDKYYKIITWMRTNNIANLYLCFGAISGFQKEQYNIYKSIYPNISYKNEYDLYSSIFKSIIEEKNNIEKSGEVVKIIHLGSYNRILGYVYNERSIEIAYPYVENILKNPTNGVLFYGTDEENITIESFLSREQRTRYWFRIRWK